MTIGAAQRITQRSLNTQVGNNLQRNLTAMGRLQQQLSSGRLISRPSDSPTGTVSALQLRSEMRRSEQYQRNASDGLGWLGTADNTLTDTLDAVRRVRDLALQGANASTSESSRNALAAEVRQLREHVLAQANTTYLGQPLFGGTSNVAQAYDAAGVYQGNTDAVARTVGRGIEVQVALPGSTVFGPPGGDLFAVMAQIEASLLGDPSQLTNGDIGQLDEAFLRLQDSLALVGARFHQVEAMSNRASANHLDAGSRLAEVESIDLPYTIMELQLQEVAYQAALGAASRVLQPSLVDFLR